MTRRYRKTKRLEDVAQTRRKIVEATMHLHQEQGVLATTWEDIAHRAGVSIATVYRHFPTLNELVPACGALTTSVIRPPTRENAEALFDGASSTKKRVEKLAAEFCEFYERAERAFPVVYRDAEKVAGLKHFLEEHVATLDAYIAVAIGPQDRKARAIIAAILDFPMWQGLVSRGVLKQDISGVMSVLVLDQLKKR
jgi:AcrR family transcriptional regulator